MKVKLKEERKKLRQDIDSLENRLKWFNIAAMPLAGQPLRPGPGFLQTQTHLGKMNRKQFTILLVLVVVLGGAGLVIYKKQNDTSKGGDPTLGKKLLGTFPVNDVATLPSSRAPTR